MKLTKNELLFIRMAARIPEAVINYDCENEDEFKKIYGMTIKESYSMAENLHKKSVEALKKIK